MPNKPIKLHNYLNKSLVRSVNFTHSLVIVKLTLKPPLERFYVAFLMSEEGLWMQM